jgi:hypothetical protein
MIERAAHMRTQSLLVVLLVTGCVSSRDARNGVFDENQYIKKSFLIHDDPTDPGWIMQGTIEQVSSPNPLGDLGLFPGAYSSQVFKWNVTSDKLQMISKRSLYAPPEAARADAVINAWPVTNVDLKYRVNLDGETTNFYEENQEQPWEKRQWVKLTVARNDLSDFAAIDPTYLTDSLRRCVDLGNTSSSLVPHSFNVDEKGGYLTWKVQVTMPLSVEDPVCGSLIGAAEGLAERATVTAVVMYSIKRLEPLPAEGQGYQALEIAEKDPIRRKYGVFETISGQFAPRDGTVNDPVSSNSGLLSARELATRFDPNKDIVYYFEAGIPDQYKAVFTGPGGIAEQTNALFQQAGVKARLSFKDAGDGLPAGAPPRELGDIRYNFIRYMKDPGLQAGFTGIGDGIQDPRTGERIKSTVIIYDQGFKDAAFIYDGLLTQIGASPGLTTQGDNGEVMDNAWPALAEPCKDGDTAAPDTYAAGGDSILKRRHNQSTLFNKMQQYLNKPATLYGPLNPSDFVPPPDPRYLDTYFDVLPQYVYGDPFTNSFVTPEGGQGVFGPTNGQLWDMRTKEVELEKLLGDIDRGLTPYNDVEGPAGITAATTFASRFKALTANHQLLDYTKQILFRKAMDLPTPFPLMRAYTRGARRCVGGKWETASQWMKRYVDEYFAHVLWHEFGHNLGLRHNFMGSVDQRNYPRYTDAAGEHYGMMTSSVMEYWDHNFDSAFHQGWGPYDKAALAWLYSNTARKGQTASGTGTLSVSGQRSKTEPWNDPLGFRDDGTEINYLFCTDENVTRTPLCQRFDYGITPAQITASYIDSYDWMYQVRNQRGFYKFRNFGSYGSNIATTITNLRRFIPFAADFSQVGDILRRLKIQPPAGVPFATWLDAIDNQLVDSITNGTTLAAAFHKAVIEQGSGERPFSTSVDQRFGDVNVQGIIIDKVFAAQGWLGLAPVLDQNPNETGRYSAPYTEGISDLYQTVAFDTLDTVLGGGYDTYPWLIQANIALFADDSHSQNFNIGYAELREWTAVQAFVLEDQFLEFFQGKAKAAGFVGTDPRTGLRIDCSNLSVAAGKPCLYDPRQFSDNLQTITLPDGHTWVWMFVPDRNMWIAAERDRNPVTFRRIRDYTMSLAQGRGSAELYDLERPIKFYVDAFLAYR